MNVASRFMTEGRTIGCYAAIFRHPPNGLHQNNRDAFAKMADGKHEDPSRLLLEVTGELVHGDEEVLKSDSVKDPILAEFITRLNPQFHRAPTS